MRLLYLKSSWEQKGLFVQTKTKFYILNYCVYFSFISSFSLRFFKHLCDLKMYILGQYYMYVKYK